MNKTTRIPGLGAPLALFSACRSLAEANVITPAMVGRWEGAADLTVDWCQQTKLSVRLEIHEDGTVTGAVGDARLRDALFQANRGWLGRQLNLATDYLIVGRLEGAIVAAEQIVRERVRIPVDFTGHGFKGGMNTSGSNFGGKARRWLAAAGLELHRIRPYGACSEPV